jgi:hypothetical protein
MDMTKTELKNLATAAWGEDWKKILARKLHMTREIMWRYANGHTNISDERAEQIRKHCKAQIERNLAGNPAYVARLKEALDSISKAA